MSISTDGQICYGIALPEGYSVPWEDFLDIEEWWLSVCGYKFPIVGRTPSWDGGDDYYSHKKQFLVDHPMPVEIVLHCSYEYSYESSYDYPMYIIAVKGTYLNNTRGNPTIFNPNDLVVSNKEKQVVIDFYKEYIEDKEQEITNIEPQWYLTSLLG